MCYLHSDFRKPVVFFFAVFNIRLENCLCPTHGFEASRLSHAMRLPRGVQHSRGAGLGDLSRDRVMVESSSPFVHGIS